METLWKLIISFVEIDLEDVVVYDNTHDYIDLIKDLGYDSIKLISLIIEIENAFDIEIQDEYLTLDILRSYVNLENIVNHKGVLVLND